MSPSSPFFWYPRCWTFYCAQSRAFGRWRDVWSDWLDVDTWSLWQRPASLTTGWRAKTPSLGSGLCDLYNLFFFWSGMPIDDGIRFRKGESPSSICSPYSPNVLIHKMFNSHAELSDLNRRSGSGSWMFTDSWLAKGFVFLQSQVSANILAFLRNVQ